VEFDPKIDRERPANLFINRGAAYWADGADRRIFTAIWKASCSRLAPRMGAGGDVIRIAPLWTPRPPCLRAIEEGCRHLPAAHSWR